MKILRSIQHTAFILLIFVALIYAQDFKIAPNTPLPEGSNFFNVSVASDTSIGFLVTWINTYIIGSTRYFHNYACRLSKTGEMLDSTAIFLGASYWPYYCPTAVFAEGNWIVSVNQGGLLEYVGAVRLTPSGKVLDDPPVNICNSIGLATRESPGIATNHQEVFWVGHSDTGLDGCIFNSDVKIVAARFLISSGYPFIVWIKPRIAVNGNNFLVTFDHLVMGIHTIKLATINPEGQILSIQNVKKIEAWDTNDYWGGLTITTSNGITHLTYFKTSDLYLNRYSSDSQPIDPNSVKIYKSQDFGLVLKEYFFSKEIMQYIDMVCTTNGFCFFWPRVSHQGISMIHFQSDFLTSEIDTLNSQCQFYPGNYTWENSYSLIRASALGDNVLTAWIDGRDGDSARVYGNFFDVNIYTGVEQKADQIMTPEDFSIFQNFPNPFNSNTVINWQSPVGTQTTLKVYDMMGKEIVTLVNECKPAGKHEIEFNAASLSGVLPSGVYFYRLQAGNFVETKKMILLK